ncbi:glutamate 5-kinase [Bacillus testis]|uniref:glutamate 5-kinase n=1 Tax=Bacillus testis TaxID=1622072 RepID=UPI00067F2862|nr:glutamate 5-kinase [Bacillus testis]
MDKKRIIIKIGSSSLTNAKGEIDQQKFSDHIQAIAMLRQKGHEIVLVSSGAVAAGFKQLGYPSRPVTLKGKQAAAAVGQSLLIQTYREHLQPFGILPAQILLTRDDFADKARYRNAYAAISELLARGIMPIINENDTVSVAELTFGDNDMLSALVSGMVHGHQLMIMTDINGFYTANPRKDPQAKRVDYIDEISDEMIALAGGSGSSVGTGGMKSKLLAAKTALALGVKVFIGNGSGPMKFLDIVEGKGDGTYIGKEVESINTTKQWIALHSPISGKIYVDAGAEQALLHKGSSLLPAGIQALDGSFSKGDVVEVYGKSGILGKGEVLYSSEELQMAIDRKLRMMTDTTIEISEVIHRNQWVQTQ